MQKQRTTKFAKTNSGFTLVEMLVVIAITAVLLALLVSPLVNSFSLTQRAQMLAAAQDQGRITLENMTRDLNAASYVFSANTNPIPQTTPSPNMGIPSLKFTNFLVFDTIQNNQGAYSDVPALAFNAKLDYVLPRRNVDGNPIDPTTGLPVTVNTSTGAVSPTGLTFPLAPGTTMVRYWVGLRDRTKPYSTTGDGAALAGNGDNTYILYSAEFQPSVPVFDVTGKIIGYKPNPDLFNTTVNAQGQTVPEFNDPNFFRYVTTSDVNWLSPTHADYTNGSLTTPGSVLYHNAQVDKWFQIAKPVIGIPNVDLLLLPDDSTGHLIYSNPNSVFPQPVANSGVEWDPVTSSYWPIVNTSVNFRFGAISADASAATTTNNAGAGFGGELAAADNGLPYVPTIYTGADSSWAFPYHISLYQYSNTSYATYQTAVAGQSQTFTGAGSMAAGDLIESMYTNAASPGTPVYDLDNGDPLTTTGDYVPLTVTPDTGTINFSLPALPTPTNPYNRYWQLPWANFNGSPPTPGPNSSGLIDLAALPNSPLPELLTPNGTLSPGQVQNAHIVPGSLRVYGPDGTPGLSQGQSVLYSEVSPGDTDFGSDEYMVDYTNNTVTLYIDPATQQLPTGTTQNGVLNTPVSMAFDYQANLSPTAAGLITPNNPAAPYQVKIDYQTRDLIDINLGIRVYDPSSSGPATVVTVHNQVHIGNSNR